MAEQENNGFKLSSSKLGTKEYWDDFYKLETENFKSSEGQDTGENWFDESDAEYRVIQFLRDNFDELPSITSSSKIMDLGTGNGHFLFELVDDDIFPEGMFIGIDYSRKSIEFAKEIANKKNLETSTLNFEQCDFLADYKDFCCHKAYSDVDIFVDKGTLDAIALNAESYMFEDGNSYLGYDLYPRVFEKIMKKDSILLITSCNFSEKELIEVFMKNSKNFDIWKKIDYPTFEFGGVKGSTICSIAFIKK